MTESARNNNFSLLRIAAALMVISGHMSYLTATPLSSFLDKPIQGIGVSIFFLIGGYLITQSWLSDPKPLRYATKRFFRIWPPLAAFLVVAALIVGPFLSRLPMKEYYTHPVTWNYFKNALFDIQYSLPGVFETNPYPNAVNGSLWTLPVEVVMYVLVPLFCVICGVKKETSKKTPWICIGVVTVLVCFIDYLLQSRYPDAYWVFYATDWVQALRIVPYYFIGMLYAAPGMKKILNLPLACFLVLVFSCFNFSTIHTNVMHYFVMPYLVFSIAFAPSNFISKFFDKYEISYGLYLYGFFIQQVIVKVTLAHGIMWSPTIYMIVCTFATAIVAFVSYKFIEKPILKVSKLLLKKI